MSAFNVSRAMGDSRSTLVDQVYAHSMESGMASAVSTVTQRVLGAPKLRVIEGGNPQPVRRLLDDELAQAGDKKASG